MDASTLTTLAVIAIVAALSPIGADLLERFRIPAVIIEIGIGIALGATGWFAMSDIVESLSSLGLALLMFLAGYEIEFDKLRGAPLKLASLGWLVSLVLGLSLGLAVHLGDDAVSALIIGLVLTTTALGTMLPMWRDSGLLRTRLGSHALAVGTLGEFGPILAIALLLGTHDPGETTVLLVAFTAIALGAVWLATRPTPPRLLRLYRETLHTSGQLPVRISMLIIVVLLWVAASFGLDVLLGAFTAGIVVRLGSHGDAGKVLQVKLEGIGFGFLIPIFFVVSGMTFDLDALLSSAEAMALIPVYLVLFLLVRGGPVWLLYRNELPRAHRWPLALFSATGLPLVVAITQIGVATDELSTASASSLVAAAMLSVLIYPLVAFGLLRRDERSASTTA